MTNEECRESLKINIVKDLCLEDMEASDILDDSPLFGNEGVGLDSLDAVELVVLVEKRYGVKIASAAEASTIFISISTLADYIIEKKKA